MGTSSSSSGPGSGVSYNPPWLNSMPPEISAPLEQLSGNDSNVEQIQQQIQQSTELAPARRFGNARRYLSEYIKRGSRDSLKKAAGSYSRSGMGGASNVAKRMSVSTSVGAGIFDFLQGVRDSSNPQIRDWVNQLTSKNLSAYEVADEIINQIISIGGSLEEESCRTSIALAISDLIKIDPHIDLMNMNDSTIWTIIEFFTANEAFNRLYLDIGQRFESAEYSPKEVVSRMNEMREYLKSEISAQIQKLKTNVTNPTKDAINKLLQTALKTTFEVFEEEI